MAGYGFQVNGDVGNRQIDFNASNMMPIQTESSVALYNQWSTMKNYFPFLNCCTKNIPSGDPLCQNNCTIDENLYNRYWCAFITLDQPKSYQPVVAIRPHANDTWSFAFNQAIDTDGDGLFDKMIIAAGIDTPDLTRSNYNSAVVGYVDLIVFNYPDGLSPSAETYGVRVYDENTNLIFDSGYQYLKILKTTTFDLTDPTVNYSYTPVKSDSYYIIDIFTHNQAGFSRSVSCVGASDYFAETYYSFNGITKKTDGSFSLDFKNYGHLFGCTGLTSTDKYAPPLTLTEVELS